MKILRLGDPHAKVNNLDEMEKLICFVSKTALDHKVDRIEILGDLFHTHAILRLEVLDFWTWALEMLSDVCELVVLVGNHDLSGVYDNPSSSLDIFVKLRRKNLHIVNLPRVMGAIGYVPYIHDNAKFVESANHLVSYGAKILVCHQTFSGSKYENGFYAPDGVDPELISKEITRIISGHIHAKQEFGKVEYPGTARWDTASDANQPKGLTIYEHENTTGEILSRTYVSTEGVCDPIYQFVFKEGDDVVIPSAGRSAVELVGSSVWVSSMKEKLKGKCSVRTKIIDQHKSEKRSAGKGLDDFIKNLYVTTMDRESLLKLAKEIGVV